MKTATLKRIIASVTAVTICSLGIFITPWLGIGGTDAHADGEVHSVYTNELIPASQASQRRMGSDSDTLWWCLLYEGPHHSPGYQQFIRHK